MASEDRVEERRFLKKLQYERKEYETDEAIKKVCGLFFYKMVGELG